MIYMIWLIDAPVSVGMNYIIMSHVFLFQNCDARQSAVDTPRYGPKRIQ